MSTILPHIPPLTTPHPLSRGRGASATRPLSLGRDSTTCCPSCIVVGKRRRRVRCLLPSQPPTAYRFHLTWVGSSIPARPRPTKDGQPYLRPPPATRGCHPPPEAMHSLIGKPETGINAAVMIHSRCRVTATVVSLSVVSPSAFSRRKPGASSRGRTADS
jgi:hypothetical protein